MDALDEILSRFPILSGFKVNRLLSQNPDLGPLRFDPVPSSLVTLLSSPSLVCPPQLPQKLSLLKFLGASGHLPRYISKSIVAQFGAQHNHVHADAFSGNRLRLLRCPSTGLLAAVFPAGENSDRLGFVVLDSELRVQDDEQGGIFSPPKLFGHSIVRILVNPVGDNKLSTSKSDVIGYVMACTKYSAHWFAVKSDLKNRKLKLVYLSSKAFKISGIAGACWNLQLPELSAVLLENGSLFLFDLEPLLFGEVDQSLNHTDIRGTRLQVSWHKLDDSGAKRATKWLGCEFSWHQQILIVARSDAVFSIDFRFGSCSVSRVAETEILGNFSPAKKDKFLAMSLAGPDGFHFVLASRRLLILYDIREPLKPLLQWVHGIDKPCSIDFFKLSQLRSVSGSDSYGWATESGFCIMLGSFLNCEFGLFCYGPQLPSKKGSCDLNISGMSRAFYAWELPSELALSGRECRSGSCLVKEEYWKDDLPEWVDWRHKKDTVLGFGVLGNDTFPVASEVDEFSGFTVVRIMSSGRLEAQRYCASWEFVRDLGEAGEGSARSFEDHLLCSAVDKDRRTRKTLQYIQLTYLEAFLKGRLSFKLKLSLKKCDDSPREKDSFDPESHAVLCEKLKRCGFTRSRSSPLITLVFDDVSLPTTIREIAMKKLWSELPVGLLQLAFSTYSKFLKVYRRKRDFSHDFPVVPDSPQLPPFFLRRPFCRSNRWSKRVSRSDDYIVGPIIPLPVLSSLHRLRGGMELEAAEGERATSLQCDEVMQVAEGVAEADSSIEFTGEEVTALSDDRVEPLYGSPNKKRRFLLHQPGAFKPGADNTMARLLSKKSDDEGARQGADGLEMFDDLCPIKLRFSNGNPVELTGNELAAFKVLKKHFVERHKRAFGGH